MKLTNASILADFVSGIGSQGAVLYVDNENDRVGIGTTNPQNTLQVGTAITMYGVTGIVSATSFYGDGANLTNTGSTLSSGIGTQRVVLTSQTSGTMTSSSTDSDLTFDSTTNTLSAPTFIGNGTIPIGGIIMWSGSIASIPSGWALCNGSNGTPNLTDRFIVGAGSIYSVAGVGGTADAIVVSHTHTTTVTDPGHAHTLDYNSGAWNTGTSGNTAVAANQGTYPKGTSTATTGIGVSVNSSGSSGTNQNLPPYYALAFIMRTI